MKTIIAGGRNYELTPEDFHLLDSLHGSIPITEVVCGMARGADQMGRDWALWRDIPVKEFPADWKTYGHHAGSIRNVAMAEYAEALVAFPGGRGTAHMIREATKRGFKMKIVQA
jgi:hypothetical protein